MDGATVVAVGVGDRGAGGEESERRGSVDGAATMMPVWRPTRVSGWWLMWWSVVSEVVEAGVEEARGGAEARGAVGVGAWVEINVDIRAGVTVGVLHGEGLLAWRSASLPCLDQGRSGSRAHGGRNLPLMFQASQFMDALVSEYAPFGSSIAHYLAERAVICTKEPTTSGSLPSGFAEVGTMPPKGVPMFRSHRGPLPESCCRHGQHHNRHLN